jgi:hypothetical protein
MSRILRIPLAYAEGHGSTSTASAVVAWGMTARVPLPLRFAVARGTHFLATMRSGTGLLRPCAAPRRSIVASAPVPGGLRDVPAHCPCSAMGSESVGSRRLRHTPAMRCFTSIAPRSCGGDRGGTRETAGRGPIRGWDRVGASAITSASRKPEAFIESRHLPDRQSSWFRGPRPLRSLVLTLPGRWPMLFPGDIDRGS